MPAGNGQITDTFITIAEINNQVEAQLIDSILQEREIPHRIHSFHDTAYNGLYQALKGWGKITAPLKYKTQIIELLDNIRNSPAYDSKTKNHKGD